MEPYMSGNVSKNPLTSVVTLTHNKLDCTRRCLPSLLQSAGAPWELIVVDNGSTDGTPAWVKGELTAAARAAGVKVTLICNEGNVGCSTARNQGAAAASGTRLVFVDNDVALRSRHWLATLGASFDADASIGVVGPKLVYPLAPHLIQCAGVGISRTGRVLFRGRGERRDDPRFNRKQDVQCLISACFMVRRDGFEKAGGFDEAFNPVEFEDFDLCYRIRSQGHRAVFDPAVEMYHFESVTTAGTPTLPNTGLIIRHGLLFKKRWRGMFEKEQGPTDEETPWRRLKIGKLAEVEELPVIQ
jgi:GT2 family glycosyltransferase